MAEYRWNQADLARAYDEGADVVHPFYGEIQDFIIGSLPFAVDEEFLLLDLGGGSGRLVHKVLSRFPRSRAVVVDQSQAFLDLAHARCDAFSGRASQKPARLQDNWSEHISDANAIVSMSAIHHLDSVEKQDFFRRCYRALALGGVFLNGDEVRAADDREYRNQVEMWGRHMDRIIADRLVSEPMADALRGWQARNIDGFGSPRASGDDCHETVSAQVEHLKRAGFDKVEVPWQNGLWSVFLAAKSR